MESINPDGRGLLKHKDHEAPHRSFTAKIAKNTKTIAKEIALLTHRTVPGPSKIRKVPGLKCDAMVASLWVFGSFVFQAASFCMVRKFIIHNS